MLSIRSLFDCPLFSSLKALGLFVLMVSLRLSVPVNILLSILIFLGDLSIQLSFAA